MKKISKIGFHLFTVLFLVAMVITSPLFAAEEVANKLPNEGIVSKTSIGLIQYDPNLCTNGVTLNSIAESELLTHFRHEMSFMQVIPSKNNWVNNDIIDLTQIGADPIVLIDNNTYPINTSGRVDDSTPVKLKKFETENTEVTADELVALPYDKLGSVQQQHRLTLEDTTGEYALHSMCAHTDSTDSPVLETTGEDDGNGRKRMTSADIITMRGKLNKLKIPKKGRILVLSSDHANDLLLEDLNFKVRYQNQENGIISANYYGFQVFEEVYNPVFDGTTLEKKAYAAAGVSTDRNASTIFFAPKSAKAVGSIERFARAAKDDPENRKNVVGFRLHHIAIPTQKKGTAAIIDGVAA